jgi:hypothetical protein
MAVETWGVDADHVAAYIPQLVVGSSSPVTSARLTIIIKGAAGRMNARLRGAGLDPADIAADTASDWYTAVQEILVVLIKADCLDAAHHPTGASDVTALLREDAYERIATLRSDIRSATGYDAPAAVAPGTLSTSAERGLTLGQDEADVLDRRRFGGGGATTRDRWHF